MTKITPPRSINKATKRAMEIRETYWDDVSDKDLWHRSRHAGFTTIPRTIPVLMNIIDNLSKNKPAGRAYFGLWARGFDASVVIVDNPMAVAFEAGFTGERAVTTWRQRMGTLVKLGFIEARPGSSGPYHYVLIRNPHKVVWKLKAKIQEQTFMQLLDRAAEIGAADMQASAVSTGKGKKTAGDVELS